jgi:Tfp pilus assembly PilM family ATPase
LFGKNTSRTGIDLGSSNVKLVHGTGSERLDKITHIGSQDIEFVDQDDREKVTAVALESLLSQLDLKKSSLGRIAVTAGCNNTAARDVVLPPLSEEELIQTLPFEAKKHLDLESIADPVFDVQLLGSIESEEDDMPNQTRVLLAAAPRSHVDFTLGVLKRAGIEPEVVDLEMFAGLNELFSHQPAGVSKDIPVGLLDLAASYARLHITSRNGNLMSRVVGTGVPGLEDKELIETYMNGLVTQVRDTLMYYRGRFRREVGGLFVAGGGAYMPDIIEQLKTGLRRSVNTLDPLPGLADEAVGIAKCKGDGARYVTACGLCRWWDGKADV